MIFFLLKLKICPKIAFRVLNYIKLLIVYSVFHLKWKKYLRSSISNNKNYVAYYIKLIRDWKILSCIELHIRTGLTIIRFYTLAKCTIVLINYLYFARSQQIFSKLDAAWAGKVLLGLIRELEYT